MSNLPDWGDKRVLIVGDVMIDRYIIGYADRISPEAPVPVIIQERYEDRPGGAANVALNIKNLGAKPFLVGIKGDDQAGGDLEKLLYDHNIASNLTEISGRNTTVKTRVIANGQQILRVDREECSYISPDVEDEIMREIHNIIRTSRPDAVILQDYNKGVLSKGLIEKIIRACKKKEIFIAVDPKKINFFAYENCTLFKPNRKEAEESLNVKINGEKENLIEIAGKIQRNLHNQYTLITLGDKGLFINDINGGSKIYPTNVKKVADVSGAGDSVISMATMCLISGMSLEETAFWSNKAGGQVCQYAGVRAVDRKDLENE